MSIDADQPKLVKNVNHAKLHNLAARKYALNAAHNMDVQYAIHFRTTATGAKTDLNQFFGILRVHGEHVSQKLRWSSTRMWRSIASNGGR